MDFILRSGFEPVKTSFAFGANTLRKAKKLVATDYVKKVEEKRGVENIITCFVIPQMFGSTPLPYKVKLQLGENRNVVDAFCTCCTRLRKQCEHICALLVFLNTTRSATKTSFGQGWGQPSVRKLAKQMYSEGRLVKDVFPPRVSLPTRCVGKFVTDPDQLPNCAYRRYCRGAGNSNKDENNQLLQENKKED